MDNIDGVSSSRPTLPFLFGRGSTIRKYDPASDPPPPPGYNPGYNPDYNPRVHGITVRATSIADARPALAVGPSFPVLDPGTNTVTSMPGLAPFELDYQYWQVLVTRGPDTTAMINTSSGQITSSNYPISSGIAGQMIRLTALSSQAGTSDNSVNVVSATGFPTSGSFTIRVDDELMNVTSATVNNDGSESWTVTRGFDGTTAAVHSANAPVNLAAIISVGQSTQQPAIIGSILGSTGNGLGSTGSQSTQHALAGTFVPVYVSTYNDPTSGQPVSFYRIVGFGQATLTVNSSSGSTSGSATVTITTLPSSIATQNATGRYLPPPDEIPADQVTAILGPSGYYSQFRSNPQSFAPLLVPVLVRSE